MRISDWSSDVCSSDLLHHVDLLFPSRRRWRGRWENCRLATIEREALGVVREDDLPGSQAPAAWLQYLRGGSSSQLKRVAAHNHQDVVTLAALMAELVTLHAADAEHARSEEHTSELQSLMRTSYAVFCLKK